GAGAAFGADGRLYIVGRSPRVTIYDPATRSWSVGATLAVAGHDRAAVVRWGDRILVIGGIRQAGGFPLLTRGVEVLDLVAPPRPAVAASARRGGLPPLSWPPLGDDGGIGGYLVYRGPKLVGSLPASVTRFDDDEVTVGKRYTYRVQAFDNAGNRGPKSAPV